MRQTLNSWPKGKVIIAGCTVLFLLSGMDGVLTLWGLSIGAIEEVNPIMLWLINKSPIVFMVFKLSFPAILGIVFWRMRNRSSRFVTYSLGLVLVVYSVVIVLQVY